VEKVVIFGRLYPCRRAQSAAKNNMRKHCQTPSHHLIHNHGVWGPRLAIFQRPNLFSEYRVFGFDTGAEA
jgi:hypothetical protein